jgi:hypothetical protein
MNTSTETTAPSIWDSREAESTLENDGVMMNWRHGWSIKLRHNSKWNKAMDEARTRIGKRPDVKAFLQRTGVKGYVFTPSDSEFWSNFDMEIFASGCIASWSVTGRDGKPLALTPTNARLVFKAFPNFLAAAVEFSKDDSNYTIPEPDTDEIKGN